MPFEKGHEKTGGRGPGTKNKKTEEWIEFENYLKGTGAARVHEMMESLDDEEFEKLYRTYLEYVKPKQQRADASGDQSININLHFDSDDASV